MVNKTDEEEEELTYQDIMQESISNAKNKLVNSDDVEDKNYWTHIVRDLINDYKTYNRNNTFHPSLNVININAFPVIFRLSDNDDWRNFIKEDSDQ